MLGGLLRLLPQQVLRWHPLTTTTYNALTSAHEKGKHPERALEVFEAMLQQGVVADEITYGALISACDKGKQPEHALEIFWVLLQQSVMPNGIMFSALFGACGDGEQRGEALVIFREMQ